LIHERSPRGQVLRFLIFLALYILGRLLWMLFDKTTPGQELLNPIHERLSYFITHTSCFVLQIFYPDIQTSVNHTIFIAGRPVIALYPGCTGLYPMIRLSFVLLLYPLPWRKKLVLWPFSMMILIFASTLHFMLLIPISNHYLEWYGFAHNWLTRILFYGFYFLCWMMWEWFDKQGRD